MLTVRDEKADSNFITNISLLLEMKNDNLSRETMREVDVLSINVLEDNSIDCIWESIGF